MSLLLGQLIYTSFAKLGFKALTSAEVPAEVCQTFVEEIVYQHWDSYNPPSSDYRAAYLYQISPDQTLFGWLYNDGIDDFGRSHVPYFVCYYLTESIQSVELKSIFTWLLKGPIEDVDRQNPPEEITSIELSDQHYQSPRPGVGIFSSVQEQAYLSVQQGKLFTMLVSEDSSGQSLKFATLKNASQNAKAEDASELAQVLSDSQRKPAEARVANSSASRGTREVQNTARVINELISRSEQENYQQILLSRVRSSATQPQSMQRWQQPAVPSLLGKVLIGGAALMVVMISGVTLLRWLPGAIVQGSSQNSMPGSESPLLAKTLLDTAPVWSAVLSPDGQTVIVGGDNHIIKIWNLETGQVVRTLSGHRDVVRWLVLTPDGKTLISGSGDQTIKIWNLQTNQLVQTLEQGSPVWGLALSPDGKTLFSGGEDGVLRVWELESGKQLRTHSAHQKQIFSIALSPDGKTIATASGDQTIKLWNAQTGDSIRTLTGHTDAVRSIAFSPDGSTIASASWDKTLKLWNRQSGELLRTFVGHEARVVDVRFSPNGNRLISGSIDHRINVWSVQGGTLLRSFFDHTDWVLSLSVAPQTANPIQANRFVSSSKDKTIRIWQFQ